MGGVLYDIVGVVTEGVRSSRSGAVRMIAEEAGVEGGWRGAKLFAARRETPRSRGIRRLYRFHPPISLDGMRAFRSNFFK